MWSQQMPLGITGVRLRGISEELDPFHVLASCISNLASFKASFSGVPSYWDDVFLILITDIVIRFLVSSIWEPSKLMCTCGYVIEN